MAHPALLIVGGIIAVLGPFALELAGVIPRTITFTGSAMVLDPIGTQLSEPAALIGLVIFVVTVVVASTFLSRSHATQRDALQRRFQLQAWQLRQLVPQGAETA